jgi:hypothetical protein
MAGGRLDGIYGSETASVVRQFQSEFGVHPVGGWESGHKTLSGLDVLYRDEPAAKVDKPASEPLDESDTEDASARKAKEPAAGPQVASTDVVPIDPGKPNDLGRFRCKTPHSLRIELYFFSGPSAARATAEIDHARKALAEHKVDLDIRFQQLGSRSSDIAHELDWCQLAGNLIARFGHDSTRLPVFFVPGAFLRGNTSAAGDGGITYASMKTTCAATYQENIDLDRVVVVDCCSSCPTGVLLHELGHAVGNVHLADTFMHDTCGKSQDPTKIIPLQLKKFCAAPF